MSGYATRTKPQGGGRFACTLGGGCFRAQQFTLGHNRDAAMKLLLPLSTAWSSRAVKRMKDENAIQNPYIRIKGSRPPQSPAF